MVEAPVVNGRPFLIVEEVAQRYRVEVRTVRDWTASRAIPFHRPPRTRRCLFDPAELDAHDAGTRFVFTDLPGNGVTVRPAPTNLRRVS